jgi:hypothetical protein
MGASIGLPELIIVLVVTAMTAIPLFIAVWALFTLYKMRGEQQAIRRSLENIERLLQQR